MANGRSGRRAAFGTRDTLGRTSPGEGGKQGRCGKHCCLCGRVCRCTHAPSHPRETSGAPREPQTCLQSPSFHHLLCACCIHPAQDGFVACRENKVFHRQEEVTQRACQIQQQLLSSQISTSAPGERRGKSLLSYMGLNLLYIFLGEKSR